MTNRAHISDTKYPRQWIYPPKIAETMEKNTIINYRKPERGNCKAKCLPLPVAALTPFIIIVISNTCENQRQSTVRKINGNILQSRSHAIAL